MISMISTSRQLYMDHLEQKWKGEEKAKEEAVLNVDKNESEKGFAQEQNIELQNIESALAQIQCWFNVDDESVSEGNAELKVCLLKKNSTRKEQQKVQNKIEMCMKHRQELQADEEVLNKRKKELINEKKLLIQSLTTESYINIKLYVSSVNIKLYVLLSNDTEYGFAIL